MREIITVRIIRDKRGWVRGAERLVRRFVELSSYCESPLVVEFWPKTGFELFHGPDASPLPLWIPAAGAAVAAVALFATRRRRG